MWTNVISSVTRSTTTPTKSRVVKSVVDRPEIYENDPQESVDDEASSESEDDGDHRAEYAAPCGVTNPNNTKHSGKFDKYLACTYKTKRLPALRYVSSVFLTRSFSYVY